MRHLITAFLWMAIMVAVPMIILRFSYVVAIFRRFKTWVWRLVAFPPGPPWKRNHIDLNHVRTNADSLKNIKIRTPESHDYGWYL